MYDFKIEVVSFIIKSRYWSKNDADEAASVVSLTSSSGGYINGRNSSNLELLIDKTSSIYLYVKLKALVSWIFLFFTSFEETRTHMSIKINRLEEGHNLYPLVCRRPAETVSLQRRQIYYWWGTPAYWSLVAQSSMFYLFEFCLKNKIKAHNFWITSYNGMNIFDSMSGQKGSLCCYGVFFLYWWTWLFNMLNR